MDTIEELKRDLQQLVRERRAAQANDEQETAVLLDLDIAIVRQKIEQLKAAP